MISSKFTSVTDVWIAHLKREYPDVSDISVEHLVPHAPAIQYFSDGQLRYEYPPLVKWKIGNTRFQLFLKPSFTREWIDYGFPIGNRSECSPNYDDAGQQVIGAIEASLSGKIEEHNRKTFLEEDPVYQPFGLV